MPNFDPETGDVTPEGREVLDSLQVQPGGRTVPEETITPDGNKRTELLSDTDGQGVGFTTEHPSGRVDAEVTTRAIEAHGEE
jgi:hypothetical protein